MTAVLAPTELFADPLLGRSVDVIRRGQAPSGAYVACADFGVYRYGWLRDGSFCAYAMDLVGDDVSASGFHLWVAETLERHRDRTEALIARLAAGEQPAPDEMLPTRFTLEGETEAPGDEPWPNFQLDGYGMWLWSLGQHLGDGRSRPMLPRAADLCARYLKAAWQVPCWSCWEEFDDGEHAATLAAIAAGFDAAARLLGDPSYDALAGEVRRRLVERFVVDGRFGRCASDARVDGSLLWLAVPFLTLAASDPRMARTIESVRRDLVGPGGGIYRYLGDTYFGGGQWILLTCWLAWVDALAGRRESFERSRAWVRAQAQNGDLPEQVTVNAQAPAMIEPWVERWGDVATPLLWSHAMYIVMEVAGREARWNSSR
jgi:GH15 family glucan-1,4-alpha-glucosidase